MSTCGTVTRAELRPDIFDPPGESSEQGAA